MANNQAAVSLLNSLAKAALGLGAAATLANTALYTAPSSRKPPAKAPTSASHGSRGPSSSTSAPNPPTSPPCPAPRTSRWSTSPCVSCPALTSPAYPPFSKPSASSTTTRSCPPSATRSSRPLLPSSTPISCPQVSALVRESLIKHFNIVLDDVAITHLSYGAEFSKAVEQKQVAQQEAERSKFVGAAIIRAEGESESAKLISDATAAAGMGLIELRRIEASREISSTLARSNNVTYLPGSGSQMLLGLNPAR